MVICLFSGYKIYDCSLASLLEWQLSIATEIELCLFTISVCRSRVCMTFLQACARVSSPELRNILIAPLCMSMIFHDSLACRLHKQRGTFSCLKVGSFT